MNKHLALAVLVSLLAACNPQEPVTAPEQPATSAEPAQEAPIDQLSVVNWGQQSTPAGEPFNVQADGNSGISFELSQPAPQAEMTAEFDGKALTGVVVNGVIVTATIPSEYIAEPGKYPIALTIPSQGIEIVAGDFEVTQGE